MMQNRNYGIGTQDFKSLITNDCLYVDKTPVVFKLLHKSKRYYFFSRPRRFGKSLLISTLKEIFLGNKEVFKKTWIYDKIEWKKYPIIHIPFSGINFPSMGLENAINHRLLEIAEENDIQLIADLGFAF